MKTNVIHLKNATRDMNGLENVIYATDTQIATLVEMRNNPEKRANFVKIGGVLFSPMDIAFIEARVREYYELPQYFLERHKKEQNAIAKT